MSPTEYDYERECNEIDETIKKHKGNICCEGCYRIGKKEARKETLIEVEKMIDNEIENEQAAIRNKAHRNWTIINELELIKKKLKEI